MIYISSLVLLFRYTISRFDCRYGAVMSTSNFSHKSRELSFILTFLVDGGVEKENSAVAPKKQRWYGTTSCGTTAPVVRPAWLTSHGKLSSHFRPLMV